MEKQKREGEARQRVAWSGHTKRDAQTRSAYVLPESLAPQFGLLRDALEPFITPERVARFDQIALLKSRSVLCVFENTNHCHNISAVIRSVDALGFQDALFLYPKSDKPQRFRLADSIERGASSWLSLKRMQDVHECAQFLRDAGYLIALVSLPDFSRTADFFNQQLPIMMSPLEDLSRFRSPSGVHQKVALIFGNEHAGLSKEWSKLADCYVGIPMAGFNGVSEFVGVRWHLAQ